MKKIFFLIISCFVLIGCTSNKSVPKNEMQENLEEKVCSTENPNVGEDQNLPVANELEASKEEEEKKPPVAKYTLRQPEGEPLKFKETWGYVMQGREGEYKASTPITDVCYFSADVNCYGELSGVPVRSRLKTGKARCHLVVACDSRAATHLALNPEFEKRKQLLKDIVKAAGPYDGVQIDFEYIPVRDRKNFMTFIADLRYMLGEKKFFSVCVPARFKRGTEDTYPYAEIANYCDRVFVMCYDEHWSTSKPGAVASPEWSKKVLAYAIKDIPVRKLVMGVPFYGRTWAGETTAGAWYNSGANRIMTEHGVEEVTYIDDIPSFKYTATVEVTGYFTDNWAAWTLCKLYEEAGVQKVGFWRLGQEAEDFWNWIEIKK